MPASDWEFDGHSLYDGSAAHTEPKVSTDVDRDDRHRRARARRFPIGDDWIGLAAVGDNGDLVGTAVADLEIGDASEWHATIVRPPCSTICRAMTASCRSCSLGG